MPLHNDAKNLLCNEIRKAFLTYGAKQFGGFGHGARIWATKILDRLRLG